MEIKVFGITRRASTNEKTGRVTVYSNIYGYQEFSDYELENGAIGAKGVNVNTAADTSNISIGDTISLSYEPTGFKDKNGSPQFRISSIEILEKEKSKR